MSLLPAADDRGNTSQYNDSEDDANEQNKNNSANHNSEPIDQMATTVFGDNSGNENNDASIRWAC